MDSLHGRIVSFLMALILIANSATAVLATPIAQPDADVPWWQTTICYEVFVRSFQDSDGDGIGDINGLISRLDYLNDGTPGSGDDLGVGCIWLMPIMQSPSYHGYDVTDYRTIETDYGTNADFLRLMAEAHARGIRVIVDYPLNHISVEHEWFVEAATHPDSPYRDWFIFEDEDPGYLGPWGQQVWHQNPYGDGYYYGIFDSSMPDLNFRNDDVTAEFRDITEFWLTTMGVDGFRMDAIKHVIEQGKIQENTPETIAWLREFAAFVNEIKPEAFTIGEVMGSGTDSLQAYYPDTLDAFFHFELAGTIRTAASIGSPRRIGPIVSGANSRLPDQRWGTFLTNHDEPRAATMLKQDPAKLRVAAILLLTLPGTPFIYYGEEIGLPGEKPDPNIRTPMQWSGEDGGGFTTATPYTGMQPGWQTLNVAAQDGDADSLLTTYRTWSQLRESSVALQQGTFVPLETEDRQVFAFLRVDENQTMLVVINLGSEQTGPISLTLPDGAPGTLTNALTGEPLPQTVAGEAVTIPAIPARDGIAFVVGAS